MDSAPFEDGQNSHLSQVSNDGTPHQQGDRNDQIPQSIFMDDIDYAIICRDNQGNVCIEDDNIDYIETIDVEETDFILNYSREDMSNSEPFVNHDDETNVSEVYNEITDDVYSSCQNDFMKMSADDIASYRIMSLLDSVGAPRYCYNKLIALLKKLTNQDSFDVKKAVSREKLMRKLGSCKACPRIENTNINNQEVFRFSFVDMLQDLLFGCHKYLHLISPTVDNEDNISPSTHHELWNTHWMKNTFRNEAYKDVDIDKDIMLPLILYMDKTGTDVNQRYSLEPVLFTVAAIAREQRESRYSWRHIGFVPQRKTVSLEDELDSSLQVYHDFLRFLLDGIEDAQKNPPIVTIKLPNGDFVKKRARLPIMIVMGDQLSQDTLCGRVKSNSGGAGRVHRSCMCSYVQVDNPYHECKPLDMVQLNLAINESLKADEMITKQLNNLPRLISSSQQEKNATKGYLIKKRNMFRSILRHPFTMHSLKNAFKSLDFGSWTSGIHDATFDDFMHSVESGMISYITETVYGGLTKKENESIEDYTRNIFVDYRCSTSSEFPRMRLQPGFTRQTLMTSGERVGSLLALSLSLQDIRVREVIRKGHERQIAKYLDLSIPESSDVKSTDRQSEVFLQQHMHSLDEGTVEKTLEQMTRHGCDPRLFDLLDTFQLNQMIYYSSEIFKNTDYPSNYPSCDIPEDNTYTDLGNNLTIEPALLKKITAALKKRQHEEMYMLLNERRLFGVIGCTQKHHVRKSSKRGEGSSAAVLTSNIGTLNIFLEYVLCYHAFCKYSWSLPVFLQKYHKNIKNGNSFVVEYFQKIIYRGNATIDSRFPKIHSQTRMAENILQLNTVMNFCCETGERLLKTEAKGISRTAQQRGDDTFTKQTMSRLQERCLLDSFSIFLDQNVVDNFGVDSRQGLDCTGRKFPNFEYNVSLDTIMALDRFGTQRFPDKESGTIEDSILLELKRKEPDATEFEIFNEIILRNNNRLRASPNYSKSGPWYDFANISWEYEGEDQSIKTYLLPAKCICFFIKRYKDEVNQEEKKSELMALIHSADSSTEGKVQGRIDTLLTKNFKLEFERTKVPKTHVIPVASIDIPICCLHQRSVDEVLGPNTPPITYLLPRNHWAYLWLAMNQCIYNSNSSRTFKKRNALCSLCDDKWLKEVRKTYQQYMNASSISDLDIIRNKS
ncbi:MAG: hypothetical protein ACKO63_00130 [Nodosilinea sp.]